MEEKMHLSYFITNIKINNTRLIKDFEIPLDQNKRKHLIITGKNGSGKTSLLRDIDRIISSFNTRERSVLGSKKEILHELKAREKMIDRRIKMRYEALEFRRKEKNEEGGMGRHRRILAMDLERYEYEIVRYKEDYARIQSRIRGIEEEIRRLSTIDLVFTNAGHLMEQIKSRDFIYVFFEARRSGGMSGDERFQDDKGRVTKYRLFADYVNNLKIEYLFEKEAKRYKRANEIQNWFYKFEEFLRNIFKRKDLRLIFKFLDQKMQCFITYDNQEFDFNQLSDGYSALLMIVAELIMQMSEKGMRISYDMQGVVLIDEVETHLHIALQKEVMPYLCELFPNIQFIVTTHSPFVLSSIENAVVCDLEKRTIVSNGLSGSSFESLVDTYFDTNKYSDELIRRIRRFEELSNKWREAKISEEEILELNRLEVFLDSIPEYQNEEVALYVEKIKRIKNGLYGGLE